MYFVYILECEDLSFYTGIALNIRKRMREHFLSLSNCAKYTKSHPPCAMVGLWKVEDKNTALKIEYRIKHLNHTEKKELIAKPDEISDLLQISARCLPQPLLSISEILSDREDI